MSVLISETKAIEAPPSLSEQEQEVVAAKLSALGELLKSSNTDAKYKLEVVFGKARSLHGLTPGIISFWENGSKLHGGGDAKIYMCPGRHLKKSECEALLPDMANSSGTIACVSCGQIWKGEQVIGELLFNLPMRKWADVVYNFYRRLEYNCDVYLKYSKDDIRSVALEQSRKQTWKGSQLLNKARTSRAKSIYPQVNIIKDTAAGADLLTRFYSFLTA